MVRWWFNEHYANRIGVIDTLRGLLKEYSLSNPPANKTTQIDSALTFALGESRVWFTELTANYVGYIDTTYKPSYSFQPYNENLNLTRGISKTATLTLQGASERNLTLVPSDSDDRLPKPQSISVTVSNEEINTIHGEAKITLTVALSQEFSPGGYELLVTATDGLVGQGVVGQGVYMGFVVG